MSKTRRAEMEQMTMFDMPKAERKEFYFNVHPMVENLLPTV